MSKTRGANMKGFEDETLCRVYLSVSVDSVNGANQTGDRLWSVISAKYHTEPGITITRSQSSLQSRYQTISSCVQFYIAKLNHAMNNQRSGTNEVDWVKEARDAYQFEKNKPFVFDKCYEILKDHPRFDLSATSPNTQRSRFSPYESGGSSSNLGDDSEPIDIEMPDSSRPTGRNEAKMQQKRKAKEKSISVENAALQRAEQFSSQYGENLVRQETRHRENREFQIQMQQQMERLVQCKEIDQERNNREEQRRIREEQGRHEDRENALLSMDLSRMSDQQRMLYNMRVQDIMSRRQRDQQHSQNFGNSNYF